MGSESSPVEAVYPALPTSAPSPKHLRAAVLTASAPLHTHIPRASGMDGCAPPPIQMLRAWEGRSPTVQDRHAYPPQAAERKRAQWVCTNLNTHIPAPILTSLPQACPLRPSLHILASILTSLPFPVSPYTHLPAPVLTSLPRSSPPCPNPHLPASGLRPEPLSSPPCPNPHLPAPGPPPRTHLAPDERVEQQRQRPDLRHVIRIVDLRVQLAERRVELGVHSA